MKKKIVLLVSLVTCSSGCATFDTWLAKRVAGGEEREARREREVAAWQGQERTFRLIDIQAIESGKDGQGLTISIAGAKSITLSSPLAPLPAPERAPTMGESMVEGVRAFSPWASLGVLGYFNRPQPPTVVRPEVVNPVVIGP